MTSTPLDSLLATAQEYNASDLHIIAGVSPAFRVNGEIILAESARGRLALTPALSPRRGCAKATCFGVFSSSATDCATNAARASVNSRATTAPPLLGERVGVRADHSIPATM